MHELAELAREGALEVIEATAPVLILIAFFQFVVLRRAVRRPASVLVGIAMAMLGFFLFITGAKLSLIPMGVAIGERLVDLPLIQVATLAFVLGVAVALAEPAVRILAFEIATVSAGSLRMRLTVGAIAFGVGLAVAAAVVRIVHDLPLVAVLVPGYALVIVLTLAAPSDLVPVAFDAGAVATGPVAVNFLLPLTTGLAVASQGEATALGFGVVGIIALGPILTMLALSLALRRRSPHA